MLHTIYFLSVVFIGWAVHPAVVVVGFAPITVRKHKSHVLLQAEEENNKMGGFFQGISNFFEELDNFIDDASARRLGNGAAFYGKRKSNFYGKDDKKKKADASVTNQAEDYFAPSAGGYFQWMPDENGQMRPVTRMKKRIVERKQK